ncbi:MAG: ribonuclease HII [Rhizobiaceae bacterium]
MTKPCADSPLLFPMSSGPDFSNEKRCMAKGARWVCGVDEAGRGPLAGPVTAAAVILDQGSIPSGLDDSKKLSDSKRETLSAAIMKSAIVSIAHIGPATIDAINIREASLLAMRLAVEGLNVQADHALIDGNALPTTLPCSATALVKGDGRSLSIAAASIVAKVMRDHQMERAAKTYPGYGFAEHKGYPTKAHRLAVQQLGPCAIHRMSFAPVRAVLDK